jgi:hypothetical protein
MTEKFWSLFYPTRTGVGGKSERDDPKPFLKELSQFVKRPPYG